MKKNIHPKYNEDMKVVCACGYEFPSGSTKNEIKTELCSNCHPFFTGKQKLVDTARRVEKFQDKVKARTTLGEKKGKTAKRAAKSEKKGALKTAKKTDKK